ncbi:MAG TPA: hypothetical protein VGO93_13000 [Candidatus Xenobia bacterium]
MDGTLRQQLDKSGKMDVPVTHMNLLPLAKKGDMAVVKRQGRDGLKAGDAVLCIVGGQGELCKVHQAWSLSGVACLEVKSSLGTKIIKDDELLGKVVKVRRGAAMLHVLLPTAARFFDTLMGK